MSESASLDSFVDKWRQRWPEWGLASVFVPAAQRTRLAAWFALLQELREAAWAGSDPTPGLAKLAWWQEELRGWGRGARRHPLGEALQKLDADWDRFGRALAALPATRVPDVAREDQAALRTFASGVLACESDLFGGGEPGPDDVDGVVELLRAERVLVQGDSEAAARLLPALETTRGASSLTRPRRLQQAIVRERVRLAARHADEDGRSRTPPLRLLFAAWRAARG